MEPHNHHVNAAERAIQTFKEHFVSALAMTDIEFPLQLWDQLVPQVEATLNLLCRSKIDPSKSAYEVLHGTYDRNCFLLAPPGCKAVVYESPAHQGSWGSQGTDVWYMGPSLDHYQCCHYFIPETQAYQILGSAELFPQHCQVPCLTSTEHLQGLTDKMIVMLSAMTPGKQWCVLTLVWSKLTSQDLPPSPQVLTHPLHRWMLPVEDPQRLPCLEVATPHQQRVDIAPVEQRVSAPAI